MIRTSTLILPVFDNDGKPTTDARRLAESYLASTFGGYTSLRAKGAFKNGDGVIQREDVIVYYIACEWDHEANSSLRTIAADMARLMDQECVYMETPDHGVEFVSMPWAPTETIAAE